MHRYVIEDGVWKDLDEGTTFSPSGTCSGKIPFIKYIRVKYGMGLKDAKHFADYVQDAPGEDVDIRNFALAYGVHIVVPELPSPAFPDIPIYVEGEIRVGGLTYKASTHVDSLADVVDDAQQLFKAVRGLLAKYGVEL